MGEYLLFRSGQRLCALPVQHVLELMRPRPVQLLPGLPPFVRGTCLIRGHVVPVVDLRELLGDSHEHEPQRLLLLRAGAQRFLGACVDEVIGLQRLEIDLASAGPPLLAEIRAQFVEAVDRLDDELLTLLRAAHLLTNDVWASIATEGDA